MGGNISTATATSRREAGVRLQIRQTMLTAAIVFHELAAWYLVIQTLVKGNCLPEIPPGGPTDEVFVPHAIWILGVLPVGLFGLLAVRHEVEPDPRDFTSYIRLFYFIVAISMLINATAIGFFSWELWRCQTDYCIDNKGFLIGGNVVLHALILVLEGILIGLAYLYHRDLLVAIRRSWQPHWKRKRTHVHAQVTQWETVPKHRNHEQRHSSHSHVKRHNGR